MSISSFNALAEEKYALIDHTHASSGSSASNAPIVEASTESDAITQAKALLNNSETVRIVFSDPIYNRLATRNVIRTSAGNYYVDNNMLLDPT